MSKVIRDAVSIIFSCKSKIFVITRQNHLRSFPGYLAFIGGKVDKEDDEHFDGNSHLYNNLHSISIINALVREVQEETGVDLSSMKDVTIDYIGNAISPSFNPIRFNTYFFRVELEKELEFSLDESEVFEGRWCEPSDILNEWKKGDHLIVPPIKYFIENIHLNKKLTYKRSNEDNKVPFIETISDLIQYMPLSNTLPPATRTNCFYVNGEKRIILDPSPKDDSEMEKLLNTIGPVDQILITHYHRDHYERSDLIARRLNVPILMSKSTYELILKHRGEDYFNEIKIQFINDLDVITTWKDEDVIVHSVDGHAKGHVAIAPKSLKWFIAGDLFQGVGTVVVGGENASMREYFASLEKIIKLNPKCVIPSHGIALGGVGIILKNLNHRKRREKQILELYEHHKKMDELYEKIYFGLDEKLKPYAVANIEAHLDKLKFEQKIS